MLHHLHLRDFRCWSSVRVDLHPRTTVFVGQNAQGKTSLLEAACMLLRLQSPRTAARGDLVRFDQQAAVVEGQWHEHALRCGMNATKRKLAVNGGLCTRSDDYLRHTGLVVWMDHSDMNLVRGGSEARRRYLDATASQMDPGYLHALQGYNRALRSRNYQLKRDAIINWRQADAYARVMQSFHQTLVTHRARLLESVLPEATTFLHELSGGHEALALSYEPGAIADGLFEALLAARAEEDRTRTTATGAHRDDFSIKVNDRVADAFASEGQQRSISLALKLAQAQALEASRGQAPLLLIDDVFGELDPRRRRVLLDLLPAGSQRLITTTHLDWAKDLPSELAIWNVAGGAADRAPQA